MDKTVKISVETHQLISIRAATLGVKKAALSEALIKVGLAAEEDILLRFIVTNNVNSSGHSDS